MSLSRPVHPNVHGPHQYHVYIAGDHGMITDHKDRLEGLSLKVCTRQFIENDRGLQLAIWRSMAVVFVVSDTVTDDEIHKARDKVKYFGEKFVVVISDYIRSTAAKLDEFMRMGLEEFMAFMRGTETLQVLCSELANNRQELESPPPPNAHL